MTRTLRTVAVIVAAGLIAGACAVRLGGSGPRDYNVIALRAAAGESAAQVVERIRGADATIVMLSAERDSTWFADVAAGSGLALSGPGTTSGRGLAFLTNIEMYGDTALVLDVTGGGSVHMQDALFKIDDNRDIDLMFVRIDAPDLRAAVRTLLGYVATDVGGSAALLLAIEAATPQVADSAAVLMRATLGNAFECRNAQVTEPRPALRLLYGPSARLACLSSRTVPDGIVARVQVQR
jgi:hypothetical protein